MMAENRKRYKGILSIICSALLLCADEYVCTSCGRYSIGAEKLLPKPGGIFRCNCYYEKGRHSLCS